jgi:dienelactone hydrolase
VEGSRARITLRAGMRRRYAVADKQLENRVAEIVLLHSILGPRPAVTEAAERLRSAGHVVHVPDLFEGDPPLDSYEEGTARLERIGVPEIVGRARAAVAPLGPNLVYAGFSMGSGLAAGLAARRPGARGAILMSGAPNPASVGATSWPTGVPCQIHMTLGDPGRNQEWIDEWAAFVRAGGSACDVFDYPGSGHLFADSGMAAEYDPASADLMWGRVLEFLAGP